MKSGIGFVTCLLSVALALTACHQVEEYDDNPRGTFEALWTAVDEHYCYFGEKNVDWDAVHARYAAMIDDVMTGQELFEVCSAMLDELRDGHVNLSSPWATSYYRGWWSGYPANYDARVIEEYYFNFNYKTVGSLDYGVLPQNIGYIHYGSFATGLGEGNLDWVLDYLSTCDALIIDIRDNGGGSLTNVETLVSRFIDRRTLVGYIRHKTGPAHDAFSEPYAVYYEPPVAGHVTWGKPVALLTNRSTYSAANNCAGIMRGFAQVTLIGDTTGGGSGIPFGTQLPNGWNLRMSASPFTDAEGTDTESGIEPDIAVMQTDDDTSRHHDTILDTAIGYLCGDRQL